MIADKSKQTNMLNKCRSISIGAEAEVGSITEGKVADFLVCNADYSEKRVFLAGKELK